MKELILITELKRAYPFADGAQYYSVSGPAYAKSESLTQDNRIMEKLALEVGVASHAFVETGREFEETKAFAVKNMKRFLVHELFGELWAELGKIDRLNYQMYSNENQAEIQEILENIRKATGYGI